MMEDFDFRVVVLTVPNSTRLAKGIPSYPSCLPSYEVYEGVTPKTVKPPMPSWFVGNRFLTEEGRKGTWCCMVSKLNLLKDHYEKYPDKDLLFLEDDVRFIDNFDTYFTNFMKLVPDDWDIIWIGGAHRTGTHREVVPGVLKCAFMVDTECVLFNHKIIPELIEALEANMRDKETAGPSDGVIGTLSSKRNGYSPLTPFACQEAGFSYIRGHNRERDFKTRFVYLNTKGRHARSSQRLLEFYK